MAYGSVVCETGGGKGSEEGCAGGGDVAKGSEEGCARTMWTLLSSPVTVMMPSAAVAGGSWCTATCLRRNILTNLSVGWRGDLVRYGQK